MIHPLSQNLQALDLATKPTKNQRWNVLNIIWMRQSILNAEEKERLIMLQYMFSRLSPHFHRTINPNVTKNGMD